MRRTIFTPLFLLACLLFLPGTGALAESTPAFPGAVGKAAATPGGRGGKILRVTTLESTGPGSITEAVKAKGPRLIVFEVGGVIDLKGKNLNVTDPFITIAGQTAPSPGITFIKGGMVVETHDVVVRHIRVRPGEMGRPKKSGWNADGITTVSTSNVIFDHCSCTWATDENLSTSGPRFEGAKPEEWFKATSHDITISNCLIAEGLSQSTHSKGEHSKGTLIHDNTAGICIVGNLYASNMERNPLAKGGAEALIVNNWISNPGRNAIHAALVKEEWKGQTWRPAALVLVGNVMEHGPDTLAYVSLFGLYDRTPLELFMEDNLAFLRDGSPGKLTRGEGLKPVSERLFWIPGLQAMPAAEVKGFVAKNAGARPWDRDAIDQRIIDAALAGKGKIINSEQEVGGYPQLAPTKQEFRESEWNLDTMERKDGKH